MLGINTSWGRWNLVGVTIGFHRLPGVQAQPTLSTLTSQGLCP